MASHGLPRVQGLGFFLVHLCARGEHGKEKESSPPFLPSCARASSKSKKKTSRPGLLEAWLVLTSVKYHGNLYILIPLNQRLALTRLRATGPRRPLRRIHMVLENKSAISEIFHTFFVKPKSERFRSDNREYFYFCYEVVAVSSVLEFWYFFKVFLSE